MKNREEVIQNYIDGYNGFDIDKMIKDIDEGVEFENVSNGETNMSLIGLEAFKAQADRAKHYFSTRTQNIKSFKHKADETEIEIDYQGIVAMDFPGGLKKGDELKLQGKSIFKFAGGKIIKLTDIS